MVQGKTLELIRGEERLGLCFRCGKKYAHRHQRSMKEYDRRSGRGWIGSWKKVTVMELQPKKVS